LICWILTVWTSETREHSESASTWLDGRYPLFSILHSLHSVLAHSWIIFSAFFLSTIH
jgi:hypothetical protein